MCNSSLTSWPGLANNYGGQNSAISITIEINFIITFPLSKWNEAHSNLLFRRPSDIPHIWHQYHNYVCGENICHVEIFLIYKSLHICRIYAVLLQNMCFVAFHALFCGEQFNQKLRMWRENLQMRYATWYATWLPTVTTVTWVSTFSLPFPRLLVCLLPSLYMLCCCCCCWKGPMLT